MAARQPATCKRDGCPWPVAKSHRYCTLMCRLIEDELKRAQRVTSALGGVPSVPGELWAEIVTCADAWARYRELDRQVYDIALSAGYIADEWNAIRLNGYPTAERRASDLSSAGTASPAPGRRGGA